MEEQQFRIAIVARMKHGEIYGAIKKRGWTIKKAAEFLGLTHNTLSSIINLRMRPPFLFTARNDEDKKRARELEEKLMELTDKSIEELFPEEFRTKEFLDAPKVADRFVDVPTRLLLEQTGNLALPKPPDELLIDEERLDELEEIISELPEMQQGAVRAFLNEKNMTETGAERGVTHSAESANFKNALREIRRKMEGRVKKEITASNFRRFGISFPVEYL